MQQRKTDRNGLVGGVRISDAPTWKHNSFITGIPLYTICIYNSTSVSCILIRQCTDERRQNVGREAFI